MALTILIAWPGLAVLAVLFIYCCSCVSDGARRELTDDDFDQTTPPGDSGARVNSGWAIPIA
jgi:hypothetical protein